MYLRINPVGCRSPRLPGRPARTSCWLTVALLLLSLGGLATAGGRPGPRLSAEKYRARQAIFEQRASNQAALFQKHGNAKQQSWSEANKLRAGAEALKARAAEATDPAERQRLWQEARSKDAQARAVSQGRPAGGPKVPAEPGTLQIPESTTPSIAPKQTGGAPKARSSEVRPPVSTVADRPGRRAAGKAFDTARLQQRDAVLKYHEAQSSGDPAAMRSAELSAMRAERKMLDVAINRLRQKADRATAAGNLEKANEYLDRAAQLRQKRSEVKRVIGQLSREGAAAPADASGATGPQPAGSGLPADRTRPPSARAAKPAQVGNDENPFEPTNAFRYKQRLPDQSRRTGDRLRDVKRLAGDHDFEGAVDVLKRMEEKAKTGNFVQRAIRGFQAARARRAIVNEAGRVMRDGAESYARSIEEPYLRTRMKMAAISDNARAMVEQRLMSVGDATQEFRKVRDAEFSRLPRREQQAVVQAERVLEKLARAEKKHKAGPVRALISRVGALVFGSAGGTLRGGVAQIEKRAAQLAKQGPEGALAAHLMVRHAMTVARNAADLGLDPRKVERKTDKTVQRAVRTLTHTIKLARNGDPDTLALAYDHLEAMRLDNPGSDLARRIEKDMVNYERDMREASLKALDQISRYAETLAKMKQPEAHAEAARLNTMALAVRDVLLTNGVAVPRSVVKRIDKVDDRVNGRTKFGYKFRHADGALAKSGVVLASTAKLIGKIALLPVRVATLPVRLPYKIGKRIIKGNGMLEPAETERKLRGLQNVAMSYMPESVQQQMMQEAGGGGPGPEEIAAAQAPAGLKGYANVPPPAVLDAMPGH